MMGLALILDLYSISELPSTLIRILSIYLKTALISSSGNSIQLRRGLKSSMRDSVRQTYRVCFALCADFTSSKAG